MLRTWPDPSPRKGGGITGVDVDDVACRLRGPIGSKESYSFGDFFRIDAALEQAALAIDSFELVRGGLVLVCALLRPFALPDARATQHGVRVNDVYANAPGGAFERQTPGEMQLRSLCRAIGCRASRCCQRILRADEHDRAADGLDFHQLKGLPRHEEIAGRENADVAFPQCQRCFLHGRS